MTKTKLIIKTKVDMKKPIILIAFMLTSFLTFAQEQVTDTVKAEKNWDINLDIASRYIWRGQSWGGNYPVVQLYGNYNVTDKFSVGLWATHNFKKQYYDANGASKGYQELDFVLNYSFCHRVVCLYWCPWLRMSHFG